MLRFFQIARSGDPVHERVSEPTCCIEPSMHEPVQALFDTNRDADGADIAALPVSDSKRIAGAG